MALKSPTSRRTTKFQCWLASSVTSNIVEKDLFAFRVLQSVLFTGNLRVKDSNPHNMHCAPEETRGYASIIIDEWNCLSSSLRFYFLFLTRLLREWEIFHFRSIVDSVIRWSGNTHPDTTLVDNRTSYAYLGTVTAPAFFIQLAQGVNTPYL